MLDHHVRTTGPWAPDDDAALAVIEAALAAGPAPDDAPSLEMFAATLAVPALAPDMPSRAAAALLAAVERQHDRRAAGVLTAIAALAGEPHAGRARAAVDRLRRDDVISPVADRIGTLAVREAVRMDGGESELLVAALRRPRSRRVQVAVLAIEHEHSGGALVECLLMPPMCDAEARAILDPVAVEATAPAPQSIDESELTRRVRAAAQRTIDGNGALSAGSAPALKLIALALTGDAQGLPCPAVLPPWEDDDEELLVDAAEDEDAFFALMDRLLDELEEFAVATYPPGSVMWQHGHFVASTMLEWKGGYGDGILGRWTLVDLAEYMLDHVPRKLIVDQETRDALPECALGFLHFLDERGSLSGAPIEQLRSACDALAHELRGHADDGSQWGLAKSLVMRMQAEGVDPTDPRALEAWTDEFNARPIEERDAVVGGACDRMLGGGPASARPGKRSAPSKSRAQGKAQRSARKRNRRRS